MALSEPLDILLTHDHWATGQVLRACEPLSNEQFHQKFDMGLGSLHDTLTHILRAMKAWGNLLAGRPIDPTFDDANRSPADLLALHEEIAKDFAQTAHAHPVEDTVSGERGGHSYTFPRGGVLTHVATHGMHHRAQCLNMLRQLGVDPLPPVSVVDWTLTANTTN